MILAAGFGTRFRPITYTLPKPLIPVRGKPLIAYAVENYLAAGVDEIVVNLHHLPEAIERYLADTFDCKFHFSREEEILGTGGALRRVRNVLADQDEFYLVNGDTIQNPPFAKLSAARGSALAALTLRHPPAHDKFTPVWFEDGAIKGFGENLRPATRDLRPLMFSGSHAISTRIFDRLPEKEFFSIVNDVYANAPLAGVIDDGSWFDIGTPQRYLEASGEFAGARSVVEGTINGSAVWDDCHIGRGVVLNQCIVANGVELTEPVEITRAIICNDDPAVPSDVPRKHGLVISPF
jgi:NDP-sugar pyrophosphorylase family protein